MALFAFGYRVLVRVIGLGEKIQDFAKVVSSVVSNIVRFVTDASQGIARWIARQGGWVSELLCQLYTTHSSSYSVVNYIIEQFYLLHELVRTTVILLTARSFLINSFSHVGIYHQVISVTSLKVH